MITPVSEVPSITHTVCILPDGTYSDISKYFGVLPVSSVTCYPLSHKIEVRRQPTGSQQESLVKYLKCYSLKELIVDLDLPGHTKTFVLSLRDPFEVVSYINEFFLRKETIQ